MADAFALAVEPPIMVRAAPRPTRSRRLLRGITRRGPWRTGSCRHDTGNGAELVVGGATTCLWLKAFRRSASLAASRSPTWPRCVPHRRCAPSHPPVSDPRRYRALGGSRSGAWMRAPPHIRCRRGPTLRGHDDDDAALEDSPVAARASGYAANTPRAAVSPGDGRGVLAYPRLCRKQYVCVRGCSRANPRSESLTAPGRSTRHDPPAGGGSWVQTRDGGRRSSSL